MTQLVLGTAQFGAEYGATNTVGRLSDGEIAAVCTVATQAGIEVFDTSPYYGDAQSRLGRAIPESARPRYTSKFGLDSADPELMTVVGRTLADLKVRTLDALMFHRVDDLRDRRAPAACASLRKMREEGVVERIGASVYDLSDLEAALELMPDLDIVQVPGNVLDRRILDSPVLAEFHGRGGTVHVRSAYLQGILLASAHEIPQNLSGLRPSIERIRAAATAHETTVIELLLGFLKHHPVVDAVVVGALSVPEVQQTIEAWSDASLFDLEMPTLPDALLDPREW